jgi:tRNA-Thr(GGU) m(6)t(6)A37 methyltransferase TsaA
MKECYTMNKKDITIHPIGEVHAGSGGFHIEIYENYRPALTGIDGFSHIQVFWWCDRLDSTEYRSILLADRPYIKAPDKLGIFATRSPIRPNPLALTAVSALHIDPEKGVITVPYIDAEDGSPVIDIKPYHPATERIKKVSVPGWCAHWPQWYEDSADFDWQAEFVNAR